MFRSIVTGLICVTVLASGALAQDQRVSATEKGSLLVYPKIELKWDLQGNLVQDVFVTLNNDFNNSVPVGIKAYFVSETCTWVDNEFTLTRNEPAYWAASSGEPFGVSPWDVLGNPYPDPDGGPFFVLRGYIILWAVNADNEEIRWNHLYGTAKIVNYLYGTSWEYNAYSFPVVAAVANGEQTGDPGILNLDGNEYVFGFEKLLMEFYASGSRPFAPWIINDTDLTLLILSNDFRQEGEGPFVTKAVFEIWNEEEIGFSGMEYCVFKWDQQLLFNVGGHFLVDNLHTNHGRARITPTYSPNICPTEITTPQSLLGVVANVLYYPSWVDYAGTNLHGSGTRAATIWYDILGGPPEKGMEPATPAVRGLPTVGL